jgi:thioredoxin-like negative regulator of GroEL
MDSGTLSDGRVDEYVRRNFIAVRVEKDRDAASFASLRVTEVPTTIVLRADRTEVARLSGALDPEEFIQKLRAATGKN